MYWCPGCSVDRNLEDYTSLLHYCTFGLGAANDAQNVRVDTAHGKENDQQNILKIIIWYRSIYNQTASDAKRYNNLVYKLMTDELQVMLINVLLQQFLNFKVSQGSVATNLRCHGIVNDQFITKSLLSLRENFLKIGQHFRKLWTIKYLVVFFNKTHSIYVGPTLGLDIQNVPEYTIYTGGQPYFWTCCAINPGQWLGAVKCGIICFSQPRSRKTSE